LATASFSPPVVAASSWRKRPSPPRASPRNHVPLGVPGDLVSLMGLFREDLFPKPEGHVSNPPHKPD
jgi:hypothetical protein